MKNTFPLIMATLLGIAAIFIVGRVMSNREILKETPVQVVVAGRNLSAGEELNESSLAVKEVPASAVPEQAITWDRRTQLTGQRLSKSVNTGNYILLDDLVLSQGIAESIGEGEWAVAIQIADKAMTSILHSGDEVAIVGTFPLEVQEATSDGGSATKQKDVTMVLYPRVRILEVPASDANQESEGVIVVLLPPPDAQALIAASRKAELRPVLRRPNDQSALRRQDAGMVTNETFIKLMNGLKLVEVMNK